MKNKWFVPLLFLCLIGSFALAETDTQKSAGLSLEEELQKLREAGIPTTIEELNLPEIPDEENGARVYREAFALMDSLRKQYKDDWQYMPYEGTVKWEDATEEQKKRITDLILNNPEFIKLYLLLGKAIDMKCRFLTDEELGEGAGIMLPHLAKLRGAARLLAARAKIESESGNIDNALYHALICFRTAKSLSYEPILISSLVRIAIGSIAISTLQEIVNKGDAEIGFYEEALQEIKKERGSFIVSFGLQGESILCGLWLYKKGHVAENDIVFYLQTISKSILLAKDPYWKARDELRKTDESIHALDKGKYFLSSQLLPALFRYFLLEARFDALLGAAEIGLANRIYRQANGKFADTLNQLAPEILPALTLDPFTGKDYIYRKTDTGFIVYSVGEDEKDDGGVMKYFTLKPDIVWEEKGGEIQNTSEKSQPSKNADTKEQTTGWIPEGFPPLDAKLTPEGKMEGSDLFVYACRKLSDKHYAGFLDRYRGNETTKFSGEIEPKESKYSEQELRDGIIFVYNVETGKTFKLIGTPSIVFDRKTRKWTVSGSSHIYFDLMSKWDSLNSMEYLNSFDM
jgi:hypothetical protein